MTVNQYRRFYAEEIRAVASLTQARLVDAFARVPREKFLGPARGRLPASCTCSRPTNAR